MFIDHCNEKRDNAIAYFLDNTQYCYTLKLFKLLNFLDFEHYRQTGWSVTKLDYYAFKRGPVPTELFNEIQQKDQETDVLAVRETFDDISETLVKREFKMKKHFEEDYFTPRELEIMKYLVFLFKDHKSEVMSKYSHDPDLPWKKIYGKGEGEGKIIPYKLALQSNPIMAEEPTIEKEEIEILADVFQGTGLYTKKSSPLCLRPSG